MAAKKPGRCSHPFCCKSRGEGGKSNCEIVAFADDFFKKHVVPTGLGKEAIGITAERARMQSQERSNNSSRHSEEKRVVVPKAWEGMTIRAFDKSLASRGDGSGLMKKQRCLGGMCSYDV